MPSKLSLIDQSPQRLQQFDERFTDFLAKHALTGQRWGLALVFLWFGVLKLFPGMSPAEDLAARTLQVLTFGMIPPGPLLIGLAIFEIAIGLGLAIGRGLRWVLLLLGLQMIGTLTPLFLFPFEAFSVPPIAPTLEGQYIVKNVVIVMAALTIGATVRGGKLSAQPE
jgi:uncharacterized membrane protein YphA (DoxX/SURF4 family)